MRRGTDPVFDTGILELGVRPKCSHEPHRLV